MPTCSLGQIHEFSNLRTGLASYVNPVSSTNVCDTIVHLSSRCELRILDFERAEAMLQPVSYPDDLPRIPKQTVLQQQAEAVGMGEQFRAAQQTVVFRDKINAAGVQLTASTLSGQDSIGLNDGSKNTVLATYLTDASDFGAEMFVAIYRGESK
jgi:hypothetical protein